MCCDTFYLCFLTLDEGLPQNTLSGEGAPSQTAGPSLSSPDRLPEPQWQRSQVCNAGLEQPSFVMGPGLGTWGRGAAAHAVGPED